MSTTPATDFSQPMYMDESENPIDTSGGAAVDLNDLSLLDGELETNAAVDAYATPPPIPDGRYRVKIKQLDVKGADGSPARFAIKQRKNKDKSPMFDASGKPVCYAFSALQANVVDPGGKYDNYTLTDYFVSTMVNKNGGIPIVRVLTVLGVKLPERSSATALMNLYLETLAKEPELEVDTVWEGSLSQDDQKLWEETPACKGKYPPQVKGMHRFPFAEDKKTRVPDLTVKTPELGDLNLHAQARINGYFPLGSSAKK